MANSKSVIRDIDLQNVTINLNKNKSIISDFNGFNKNTGVWFNGVLSNLYCNSDKAADDIITIDNDVYKIIDNALYKNDVLVKDYTNINKVRTEILGNIDDNVLAYTPVVHIYYEGDSVYVKSGDVIIPAGSYYPNIIPYIIIDKAADTWCVIYRNYIVCKGMTEAKPLSVPPAAALYSATKNKWYYVDNNSISLVSVTDNEVVTLNLTAGGYQNEAIIYALSKKPIAEKLKIESTLKNKKVDFYGNYFNKIFNCNFNASNLTFNSLSFLSFFSINSFLWILVSFFASFFLILRSFFNNGN